MSIVPIHPTSARQLGVQRVPRVYLWEAGARTDIVNSAQNSADTTGEPQFLVQMPAGICTEMVVSDTRRAQAVNPGRFRRYFQQQEETARHAAGTCSCSGREVPPT